MELYNEVKIDFSGASNLAREMGKAKAETSGIRKDVEAINSGAKSAGQNSGALIPFVGIGGGRGGGRGGPPNTPNFRIVDDGNRALTLFRGNTDTAARNLGDFNRILVQSGRSMRDEEKKKREEISAWALIGTAASAGAFANKAMALANPSAVQRFDMAIENTTAVIGHRLIPALEEMTRLVTEFGNFLARNPEAASGIGYGALALGGLAGAGLAYKVGRSAYGGLSSLFSDVGGLFGGSRTVTSAEMASGRAVVSGTEAAAAAGGFRGLGAVGRFAGRVAPFLSVIDPVVTTYDLATSKNLNTSLKDEFGGLGRFDPIRGPIGTGFRGVKEVGSWFGMKETDWDAGGRKASGWLGNTPEEPGKIKPSSWGAAARPTQYQDILGSVLSLRQQISSGAGKDPMQDVADNTKRTADALEKMAGTGTQPGATTGDWRDYAPGMRGPRNPGDGTPRGG